MFTGQVNSRWSVKIGDLVKDIDPSYTGQHGVGIVVDVDTDLVGVYKVKFPMWIVTGKPLA